MGADTGDSNLVADNEDDDVMDGGESGGLSNRQLGGFKATLKSESSTKGVSQHINDFDARAMTFTLHFFHCRSQCV